MRMTRQGRRRPAAHQVALPIRYAMLYEHMPPIIAPAPIFAHQFGWDEILMFAVPIVLALVGVRYAESRAAKRQAAQQAAGDQHSSEPTNSVETADEDSG